LQGSGGDRRLPGRHAEFPAGARARRPAGVARRRGMTIPPELLAAYADGELDAEAARAVEAEIAGNPALQAQLAAHRALRARLAAHFAPIAEQPVPERLKQAV